MQLLRRKPRSSEVAEEVGKGEGERDGDGDDVGSGGGGGGGQGRSKGAAFVKFRSEVLAKRALFEYANRSMASRAAGACATASSHLLFLRTLASAHLLFLNPPLPQLSYDFAAAAVASYCMRARRLALFVRRRRLGLGQDAS